MTQPSDEALWRRRFALFALLRIAGLALMVVGAGIGLGDVARRDGLPPAGGAMAIVGFVIGIIIPRQLRRRWRK